MFQNESGLPIAGDSDSVKVQLTAALVVLGVADLLFRLFTDFVAARTKRS
jgi:hypothetical protein